MARDLWRMGFRGWAMVRCGGRAVASGTSGEL